MDDIISRITAYAEALFPALADEEDAFISFVVGMVIDKALIYTNRNQLVEDYEEDLVEYANDENYWKGYDEYPIPSQLERPLAMVVVQMYRTVKAQNDATNKEVKSVSDNGQSVTFGDAMVNYLNSTKDAEVFAGISSMLDQFVIPTIVENHTRLQKRNKGYIL